MASLFSSRREQWGLALESNPSAKITGLVGAIALVAGIAVGWIMHSPNDSQPPVATATDAAGQKLEIVEPSIEHLITAPQTEQGAARAAGTYVVGFPYFATGDVNARPRILNNILAPTAAPDVREKIDTLASAQRIRVLGIPGQERQNVTARWVISPITYKVDFTAQDQARVRVWSVDVLIDPFGALVASTWYTDDVQLVWTDHWRIVQATKSIGPTPELYGAEDTASPYNEVAQVFDQFKAFRSALPR